LPTRLVLVLLALFPLAAQDRAVDHNAHGWYQYFGDHPVGESQWGVHLEGQFRRHDVIRRGQQLLLRPGVNYEVNRHLMLTAGYAFVRTYRYGEAPVPASFNEHRIWEQAWFRYGTGKVGWSTRVRFENRFLSVGPGGSFRHENRIRAWQQVTVPLRGSFYLTGYDEIWFYVKPYVSNSAFDQNRAYGALGFRFSPTWRMEVGYMNQAILQRSGSVLESNHTFTLAVLSSARFRR
jgi:hypothetical protein